MTEVPKWLEPCQMWALVYIGGTCSSIDVLFEGHTRVLQRASADGSCQQAVLRK